MGISFVRAWAAPMAGRAAVEHRTPIVGPLASFALAPAHALAPPRRILSKGEHEQE